jgi:hypothetical protein
MVTIHDLVSVLLFAATAIAIRRTLRVERLLREAEQGALADRVGLLEQSEALRAERLRAAKVAQGQPKPAAEVQVTRVVGALAPRSPDSRLDGAKLEALQSAIHGVDVRLSRVEAVVCPLAAVDSQGDREVTLPPASDLGDDGHAAGPPRLTILGMPQTSSDVASGGLPPASSGVREVVRQDAVPPGPGVEPVVVAGPPVRPQHGPMAPTLVSSQGEVAAPRPILPPPMVEIDEVEVSMRFEALCAEVREKGRVVVGHCCSSSLGCQEGDEDRPTLNDAAIGGLGGVACSCSCEGCMRACACWYKARMDVAKRRVVA